MYKYLYFLNKNMQQLLIYYYYIQLKNIVLCLEFDNVGKNIALFFAIFVAFLACFVFGSMILKRNQLLADIPDVQVNYK